jgi:O-succinylbenzoic acid--CoA ligase
LEHKSFHKNFKINGVSFTNIDEILVYSNRISEAVYQFLKDWFSDEKTIFVQTSGSTGKPKTILMQKKQMMNSAFATGNYFDLKENTTALLCLPVAYIAGKMMLIRAITLGWHLDIIASKSNPLEKVNKSYDFSAMVPLQVENSLSKINLVKKLIVGGGAVSNVLHQKLQTVSTAIFATYGMTETITHIAVKQLNKFSNIIENEVDKPVFNPLNTNFYKTLPNVTIYKDQRNCLVIKAPKVSEEIIFTNDVIQLISDTQFEWLGRFDNVINSGGVKLHPEKIEEKLSKIIVNRFFVASLFDKKLGEKLILIIEQKNLEDAILIEVKKLLKTKIKNLDTLSKFENPKEIYFSNQFIETATGKIQRKKTIAKIFTK